MIRTVFLDLDDTLLDFTRTEAEAIGRVFRRMGLPSDGEVIARYHAINARQWALLEEGQVTREQLMTRRFDLLFAELGVSASSRQVCDAYEGELGKLCLLLPGARELLQTLAPRYELYVASNGESAVQRGRLRQGGLERYFRGVFISEEVGADKPAPAFFRACVAASPGFDPAAAIMVGDSLTSDIRGGRNAGIRTCWFNRLGRPAGEVRPDWEITALDQLMPLLEQL